jgi:predicted transposase YbfD/YdcC
MVVKGNQGTLEGLIDLLVASPVATRVETRREVERDVGHGRIERRAIVTSEVLAGSERFPGLAQIFQLQRDRREKKTGKEQTETVAGITSLPGEKAGTGVLLEATRGHWKIENWSHHVRDVTFGEDGSQVRAGSGPQVLAALRNTAIGLMRVRGWSNIAGATRYYAAHPREVLTLLGAAVDN